MKIFVPIKGESQRLPNKNFRMFGGVPLYKYVLDKFRGFDVYVDTDVPDRIVDVEAHVYRRRADLCGNNISVNRLIQQFLIYSDAPTRVSEPIVQIHVTSPFLEPETIIHAVEALEACGCDSVVSCTSLRARFWRSNGLDGWLPVNHDPRELKQTQELEYLCMENSLFYVFTWKSFDRFYNRIGKHPMFQHIEFPENLDIDTEADWEMAESLLHTGVAK